MVWIERSIKNSAQASATLLDHYGDILFHVGREKDAVKQWEKALVLADSEDIDKEKLAIKIKNRKYVE